MKAAAVVAAVLAGFGVVAFFIFAAIGIAVQPGLDGTQYGQRALLAFLWTLLFGLVAVVLVSIYEPTGSRR